MAEGVERPPFSLTEVEGLSHATSVSEKKVYGIQFVTTVLGFARSTYYAVKRWRPPTGRRGPKTRYTDETLLVHIRQVLDASLFVGEGHRKVWARLRIVGVRASKGRILRLMREHGLLAPGRAHRILGPRDHDGTIIPDTMNKMWGTDLTSTYVQDEGQVAVFVAIDHCTAEGVGIHASKIANRFEALEPVRQGVRRRFRRYGADVANGLKLRHDHGSQYMSDDFQGEIKFLGIESSPAFVRAPEGNGCAERFIRTLKEQLLWVRTFRNVEELRQALHAWLQIYNEHWLIERHGFRSPAEFSKTLADQVAA